jgi:hypothetical protein
MVAFDMADDRLDGGPASEGALDGLGEPALLVGNINLEHLVLWGRCDRCYSAPRLFV